MPGFAGPVQVHSSRCVETNKDEGVIVLFSLKLVTCLSMMRRARDVDLRLTRGSRAISGRGTPSRLLMAIKVRFALFLIE